MFPGGFGDPFQQNQINEMKIRSKHNQIDDPMGGYGGLGLEFGDGVFEDDDFERGKLPPMKASHQTIFPNTPDFNPAYQNPLKKERKQRSNPGIGAFAPPGTFPQIGPYPAPGMDPNLFMKQPPARNPAAPRGDYETMEKQGLTQKSHDGASSLAKSGDNPMMFGGNGPMMFI